MTQVWSVTGAIKAQSSAHDRLMSAIAEKRAVEIWMGNCRITTCESVSAANLWIGKQTKKYRIVLQSAN